MHSTERRTLGAGSHGKAHSAQPPELQNAHFGEAHTQNAPFREGDTPRVRLYVSRRLQSGAFVYTPASPRQSTTAQQCTQMPRNGAERPDPPICVHCCDPRATHNPSPRPNSVHKRPKTAPRGSFPPICVHSCVPTVARTILARRNSVHKCPKVAPRGHFSQSVYTPASSP